MMGLSPRRMPRGGPQPPGTDERTARPSSHLARSSSAPQRAPNTDLGGPRSSSVVAEAIASRPLSPRRKRSSTTMPSRHQTESVGARAGMGVSVAGSVSSVAPARTDSATGTGLGLPGGMPTSARERSTVSMSGQSPAPTSTSWWAMPGSHGEPVVVLQGLLKKRGGRINSWADRFFVLTETTLDQYARGEDVTSAEPKHSYDLDPNCICSEIKEAKSGGRPIYFFQLEWPSIKEEGDADSGSVHDEEDREAEAGGSTNPNPNPNLNHASTPGYLTPTESPTTEGPARGTGGLGNSSEDGWTVPPGKPRFERVDSSGSLTGPQDRRSRRPRASSVTSVSNGIAGSSSTSPMVAAERNRNSTVNGEGEELGQTRNETIEGMVAAQREKEKRIATLQQGGLEQMRRENKRKKKEGKKGMSTTNKAVAATAVGVSWITAGIATGGLVIAATLVAAGITVTAGSMGAYDRYKSIKNQNGTPSRIRLASDKLETIEQWRAAILDLVARLRAQHSPAGLWMGKGLGLWAARPPEGPPPALKAIDLRVVDDMLGNAMWTSRGVMQGLPILEQDLGLGGNSFAGNGSSLSGGEAAAAGGSAGIGWGLGGSGPVLKTQTIVRASPLETFVALMGAPKHSMNAVISGTFTVQSLDDHSEVVRLCVRPAWLKMAWASPRDFCLARYWHISEEGCYIVALSSMEHPSCPLDPEFVRGEAQLVYTISPRRETLPVPSGHTCPECLLCCHVQVDPKGWIWNRLGMRELYSSQILMHVLEVRNVIEAERFVAPRVSLRPESPTSCSSTPGGVGRRSPDGRPFLFEVLGAPESEGRERRGSSHIGLSSSCLSPCSLETDPPPALDPRMWTEADGTDFSVRGPSYLTTRVKVSSERQMFRLRAVDLFSVAEPVTHLAQHRTNRVQIARKAGERCFVWVLQLMVPGPPHYSFVAYFTPGADNWMDTDTPFGKLASRVFFGDDDNFRDQRLKLIPKIVEGNWVVKRAAGTTPAILGTKLKQHHFRGDNYLETDLEIASSSVAANITRLCAGYAKTLVVDMVWTIQGNTEEELPEVALAGVRLNHLDFIASKPLDLSPAPTESFEPESGQPRREDSVRRHYSRREID